MVVTRRSHWTNRIAGIIRMLGAILRRTKHLHWNVSFTAGVYR